MEEELLEGDNVVYGSNPKDNTYTLTLSGDLQGMSGDVKVVATNAGGKALCESNMKIQGRAPIFIEKPLKCTILEGKIQGCNARNL